ncbi:hypothetical protein LTR56_003282 [Elasticomyces elasticus]|nr:hypothetical protein LTR22_011846 [Elasticomyces elasticus]KAK3656150.1 hypothetical protein LTR56_003282 [Elasticomyces elasticus]KAK4912435.1 hypothetical protein LTR49_019152 [Elasticomyces elasticus]KAK5751676.1 hypothetical protein LTS12_018288 [Elasticomyces elasticus]
MSDTTPPRTIVLSPFDRAMGAIYIRKVFGFGFDDPSLRTEAISALRQGLLTTIKQHPIAAASIELVRGRDPIALAHPDPSTIELSPPLFVVKELSAEDFTYTYQQLCRQGAPPSKMKKEILSSLPEHPQPGEICPALGLQVTFIEGGLMLCFAFHHTIFDGAASTTFLHAFGANVTARRSPEDVVVNEDAVHRLPIQVTAAPPDLSTFPEYDFSNIPLPSPSSRQSTSRILTFTTAKLADLRSNVLNTLYINANSKHIPSLTDCLRGLLWVSILRARQDRVPLRKITNWAIAVNARTRLNPRLRTEVSGNAVVHTLATAEVFELVSEELTIDVFEIAVAASRIRHAVDAVGDAYIRKRVALFSSVRDPAEIAMASKRALDMPNTGMDFSDWREHGADVEFGIPGADSSKPDWVRKTWSANEGAINILPRKGGRAGAADWEVLLALNAEDMEEVCSVLEDGGWVSRVVE